MTDPQEVLPRGNEEIYRINSVVKSKRGFPLWKVTFTGDTRIFLIRESVVAYYWPVEAALFKTYLAARAEARLRYLQNA